MTPTTSALPQTGSPQQTPAKDRPKSSDESLTIQMILAQFFRREDSPEVRAIEVASWRRVLQGRTAIEILASWEAYQAHSPRDQNGRLIKPTPHYIERRIAQMHGDPVDGGIVVTGPMKEAAKAIIEGVDVSSFWVDGAGGEDLVRAGLVARVDLRAAQDKRRRWFREDAT